jgi:transposase InsO family protein
MDRKTARKYLKAQKLPSELRVERTYRTRPNPFIADWGGVVEMLEIAPELEAKTLFDDLLSRRPVYLPGQLRTFQRHVRYWRAQHGPDKEVYFAQCHRPGEAAQTDFTWATELGIMIDGELFEHMLCHVVLPYSNWSWATICRSESMAALKKGVQEALFRLGRHPEWHQTDNSTAATHNLPKGFRDFNVAYLDFMAHHGMKPRTIAVGQSHQNGDVEACNGALKARLKQHLLLRGSSEFASVAAYERWLHGVLEKANIWRDVKVQEELKAMTPLTATRVPEFTRYTMKVTSWSTIRVKHNSYSVPSRLIGETLDVRAYEGQLEVRFRGRVEFVTERMLGRNGHRIDYRHVIWSLVRKPGAFARYRYREDLFPSLNFRRAYDALSEALTPRKADLAYLRILHLAASTMESEVELALECLLEVSQLPLPEEVKALVGTPTPSVPAMKPLVPELSAYDALLKEVR